MKVFTNSQDKLVGGIARMMNTFVESVIKTDTSVSFHFAIVSSDKNLKINEKKKSSNTHYGFQADRLVLSSDYYLGAVSKSSSLEQFKNNLIDLIDFYLESIDNAKPDIILINGTYYRPWALLQAARQRGIPYVVYIHGSVLQESQGSSGDSRSLFTEMEMDFYSPEANYIFPSLTALKGVTFSKLQSEKFHIIYNSLDESFFSIKKPRENKPKAVGFVLRWEKVKNIDFILNLIKFNRSSLNPYTIKVVSDIHPEKSAPFQDKYTEFLPPKTQREMVDFYQEMDVVINPSFFETFGYVPAEAVACGTPAIVSANQGIAEIFLKCGLERFVCDMEDVSLIYRMIPEMIQKGISLEEFTRLREELDPRRLSQRILSVLSAAISLPIHSSTSANN